MTSELPNDHDAPKSDPNVNVPEDERRHSMRFSKEPVSDFAIVVAPQPLAGRFEVHDESLGGIAIVVDDPTEFTVGLKLNIEYAGDRVNAVVRHRRTYGDGRFLVGLECDPPA